MNRALAIAVVLVVAVFVGCGGDSETSSTTTPPADTNAATTEDTAAAEAAVVDAFREFNDAAHRGDGEAACATFTSEFREEWEEIQSEPLEIEGKVIEQASPSEAACENSVLETVYARFPLRILNVEVDGSEAEGEVQLKQGGQWNFQAAVTFVEEDNSWLIAGDLIGG